MQLQLLYVPLCSYTRLMFYFHELKQVIGALESFGIQNQTSYLDIKLNISYQNVVAEISGQHVCVAFVICNICFCNFNPTFCLTLSYIPKWKYYLVVLLLLYCCCMFL